MGLPAVSPQALAKGQANSLETVGALPVLVQQDAKTQQRHANLLPDYVQQAGNETQHLHLGFTGRAAPLRLQSARWLAVRHLPSPFHTGPPLGAMVRGRQATPVAPGEAHSARAQAGHRFSGSGEGDTQVSFLPPTRQLCGWGYGFAQSAHLPPTGRDPQSALNTNALPDSNGPLAAQAKVSQLTRVRH